MTQAKYFVPPFPEFTRNHVIVRQLPPNLQLAIGFTDLGNTPQLIITSTWIEGVKKNQGKQDSERSQGESWRSNKYNYIWRQSYQDKTSTQYNSENKRMGDDKRVPKEKNSRPRMGDRENDNRPSTSRYQNKTESGNGYDQRRDTRYQGKSGTRRINAVTINDTHEANEQIESEQEIHYIQESDQNIETREIATIRAELSFDVNENKTQKLPQNENK